MFSLLKVLSVCVLLLTGLSNQAVSQTLAPETFDHPIAFEGENYTVNFTKQSFRGPLFDVVLETSDSESFVDFEHSETIRTYLGTVVGQPGSIAAGMIRADGEILARVTFANGDELQDVDGVVSSRMGDPNPFPSTVAITPEEVPGSNILAADVLIDFPFEQYQACGGTPAKALEMAEFSIACINTSFLRDAAVLNRVGYVIFRTDQEKDPYKDVDTTRKGLDKVQELHRSAITSGEAYGGQHDLGLHAEPGVGGGLAYINVVSTSFGFSSNGANSNGDFTVVGRHEIGHNWGSGHFEGGGQPEGRTIMSGNRLGKFSLGETKKILAQRVRRAATLDEITDFTFNLPPRAFSDKVLVEVGSGSVDVDPLLNDHDSNGDALTISSVDAITDRGQSIAQIGNTLSISVPSDFSTTADSLSYSIQDTAGAVGEAEVFVETFMGGDTLGHYTFDCSETEVLDSSSYLAHGTLSGDSFIRNQVLHVDGSGDGAPIQLQRTTTNTVTYAAMVYRDGEQNDYAPVVFQNAEGESHGLNFGTNNELRYHWDTNDWRYNSGLVVPDKTWTFVALVVTPDAARFYMDSGNGLQSAVRADTHVERTLSSLRIGQSGTNSSRSMKGMIDDVRIIKRALTEAEIIDLSQDGLGACNPLPFSGAKTSNLSLELEWTSSSIATEERLYLSTSYLELRDAEVGSPADQGIVSGSMFSPSNLAVGHYYWRVDSTEGGGRVTRGHTWTFEITADGLIAHYPLDELVEDETPCECSGDHSATVMGTPVLSSDAVVGSSMAFNRDSGSQGSLEVPATVFSSLDDQIALSFWAKGDASQGQNQMINARDAGNNRILGIHLPWTNGQTYWDAGNSSGYDRINSTLSSDLTANFWTHWVFQKNATTGVMEVYANGEKVMSGTGKNRLFDSAITRFSLGDSVSRNLPWRGLIDDFRIYDKALTSYDITSLYQKDSHLYQWLREVYPGASESALKRFSVNADDNLLDYSVRTNPDSPDISLYPEVTPQTISYVRPAGGSGTNPYYVGDLAFSVEFSTDLSADSWSPDLVDLEEAAATEVLPGGMERMTLSPAATDATELFHRVRIHRPE